MTEPFTKPTPEPTPEERVRVGRYLLCESLGSGGMGEVHRSRFYAAAGVVKELCIKRIRSERLGRAGAVDRFIAEAHLSMRLSHGNIVSVFDFGRAGDEYYLAMEWVDGADLRAILERAHRDDDPLRPEVAAQVAAEVARALSYAHEVAGDDGRAVVHRDVKPANVLISRAGEVKLSDFGVATVVGQEQAPGLAGTRSYMAPEQQACEPVDPRSDLYSLGLVLAEMLGEADDPTLAALQSRLVESDPGARPGSAREVANLLEEVVSRARAEGCRPPRDDLARRAAMIAGERRPRQERRALDADASFVVDGATADFDHKMTGSTQSQSALAAPVEPGPPPQGRTRRRSPTLLIGGSLVLLIGAAFVARAALDPPTAPDQPGTDEAMTGAASPGDEAPAEPRRSSSLPHPSPTEQSESPPPGPATTPAEAGPRGSPRSLRPTTPRRLPRPPSPEPAPAPTPATLSVNAVPWAEVSIDGRRAGVTPLFGLELPPGTHRIHLTNDPLGAERTERITLDEGERRELVVDLRE